MTSHRLKNANNPTTFIKIADDLVKSGIAHEQFTNIKTANDIIQHYEYAIFLMEGQGIEGHQLESTQSKLDELYAVLDRKPSDTYDAHITAPAP